MTTTEPPFVVTCPEDFIAFAPVALGFEPRDSVVLLTFGGTRPFHARLDVPPLAGVDECIAHLVRPARKHGVARATLLLYTGDRRVAGRLARRAAQAFQAARIPLVDVLRVHDGRWYAPLRSAAGDGPDHGVPYDVSAHPFRARAVLLGKVTLGSREELVASLDPDEAAGARVAAALADVDPLDAAGIEGLTARCAPDGDGSGTLSAAGDREVAAVLLGLTDDEVLLETCRRLRAGSRSDSRVPFWLDVVRRSPRWLVAEPAALLAFVAWLAGNGALAWCAVDRSRDCERHPLADLVAGLLEDAVPPEAWRGGLRAMPEDGAG